MISFGTKKILKNGPIPNFKFRLPAPYKESQFLQIYFVGEDDREARLRYHKFPYVKPGLVR